jgi:hypothetical protein
MGPHRKDLIMRRHAPVIFMPLLLIVLATAAVAQISMYKYLEFDVDDVPLVVDNPGATEGFNGWQIQLTDSYSGAVVEWDHVRFEAGPDAVSADRAAWGEVKTLFR